MPLSSIPRLKNVSASPTKKARSPFLLVFLSTMLAVYIGFISYWLITSDDTSDLATTSAAQLQTSLAETTD